MKKILCLIFAVAMVISSMSFGAIAVDGADGKTFDSDTTYNVTRGYEEVPLSFEAWVCIPKNTDRAGVILGNYEGGKVACVNFEINTNGRPRIYVIEKTSGTATVHDINFSANVKTGEPVHVAIVHDPDLQKTHCYVNGELSETKVGALNITAEVCKNAHRLGGDRRDGNAQYFKGTIKNVAVYNYSRSASDISKAVDNGVDVADEGLIAYYNATEFDGKTINDKSGNGYHVQKIMKWFTEKEPVTDYAYSFCVVGDTQIVTELYPDNLANIYDWIVENKQEKKIEFVFGMGDITNKSTAKEWSLAKEQIFKMNGVVPYSLVRGNHDGIEGFSDYFDVPAYSSTLEGRYEEYEIVNAWRTFKVGNTDFLVMMLDYGPSDAVLEWAGEVIEQHPQHKVIITTHCYLFRDGTTLDANDVCPPNSSGSENGTVNNGDQMWDKLVSKHENIFLVLSGHDPSNDVVAVQTEGVHGNVVTQMLVDPQGVDSSTGATGMVAMLYFSNDGTTMTVEQYSTVKNKYYMNTSQFEIPLPESFWVKTAEEAPQEEAESVEESVTDVDYSSTVLPPKNSNKILVIGIVTGASVCAVIAGVTVYAVRKKKK